MGSDFLTLSVSLGQRGLGFTFSLFLTWKLTWEGFCSESGECVQYTMGVPDTCVGFPSDYRSDVSPLCINHPVMPCTILLGTTTDLSNFNHNAPYLLLAILLYKLCANMCGGVLFFFYHFLAALSLCKIKKNEKRNERRRTKTSQRRRSVCSLSLSLSLPPTPLL